MSKLLSTNEMQSAYLNRDPDFDGLFILGVKTTGIFCRPTCPARKPLPKNVEYFASSKDALSAGYRPCKRCRPMNVDDQPEWVSRLIEEIAKNPTAKISEMDLRERDIDPGTVRRYFKKHFGMTFHAYARARRMSTALTEIRNGASIDHAAFDAGFSSQSGFRDAFLKSFGSSPGASKSKELIYLHWIRSPIGPLVAAATDRGICLLEFSDRRMLETQFKTLQKLFPYPAVPGTNQHLEALEVQLAGYFEGVLKDFSVSLDVRGSDFQQRVWNRLIEIPYGTTMNYEELAQAVECPGGQRSVGRVNGQNRIAIVIPCHRVIGKNGQLTGYGGGLHRKQFMLDLEREPR